MSIMATKTTLREQPPGTYTCQRCGIQPLYNQSRPKPERCADCRAYKTTVAA